CFGDDTIKVPVIEHQIYMCSACRHIARRLVFRRTQMPITHLPATATPIGKLRVAAPRPWGNAVEKLRSRQVEPKERAAAAAKTAGWTKAVEKVRNKQAALAAQAAVASRLKLAEPVRAAATASSIARIVSSLQRPPARPEPRRAAYCGSRCS